MRNYLIAFFVLMAACAFGANVTFQSFNTNQFKANAAANSVSLNSAGTNIVDSTDLVLNTIYTNSSGSNLLVTVGLVTTPGATAGSGALEINQSPTNNFPFITSLNVYVAIGGSSGINQESVSGFVQPGGVYVATNLQGIVSILANSCQRVYSPIGGGVGPTGATGPVNLDGTSITNVTAHILDTTAIAQVNTATASFLATNAPVAILVQNTNYVRVYGTNYNSLGSGLFPPSYESNYWVVDGSTSGGWSSIYSNLNGTSQARHRLVLSNSVYYIMGFAFNFLGPTNATVTGTYTVEGDVAIPSSGLTNAYVFFPTSAVPLAPFPPRPF